QNVLAAVGRKPGQLGANRVGPGRQVDQPIRSVGLRDRSARLNEGGARCGDRDAWQRPALLIGDVSSKAALAGLRRGKRGGDEYEQETGEEASADHRTLLKDCSGSRRPPQ